MSIENSGAPAPVENTPSTESTVTEETSVEGEEDLAAEGQEDPVIETPAQEKKRLKKLKLKVDGEEFEEELPFEIDEEHEEYIKKQLQLAKMSQKRAQYASDVKKQAQALIDLMRTDPMRVITDPSLGIDVKKVLSEYIESQIQEEAKTPEQKEREKMEKELKALREEREKEKEAHLQREKEALEERELQRYDRSMSEALNNNPDLPKTPYVVKKMAEHMLALVKKGINASPQDVVEVVREEMRNDLKQMFAVLPEEVIENLVGKETINKLRKKSVAKAKASISQPVNTAPVKTKPSEAQKTQTFKDFFKF